MDRYVQMLLKWLQAVGVGAVTAALVYINEAVKGLEGDPMTIDGILLGLAAMLGTKAIGWLIGKLPAGPQN